MSTFALAIDVLYAPVAFELSNSAWPCRLYTEKEVSQDRDSRTRPLPRCLYSALSTSYGTPWYEQPKPEACLSIRL